MMKRILALLLCLVTVLAVFAGCAGNSDGKEDKGQYLTMYLTDILYDLDPANAYYNESTINVISLMFDTLFTLKDNGKVKKSLVKKYTIEEDPNANEYMMYLELAETYWSDNTLVSANDVVYAWKRILDVESSYEAAALLFDIKNARAAKEGECSIDDVAIYAEDTNLLSIQFEKPIDYDNFILNLTSLALAPLREDIAGKSSDWAKKPATMVTSGPFKLSKVNFSKNSGVTYSDINYDEAKKVGVNEKGDPIYEYFPATEPSNFGEQLINSFVLERNSYYYRNSEEEEALDKSVTPYQIIVDCSMSDADIKEAYDKGTILYIGDIPLSLRNEMKDIAVIEDALSTHTYFLNENAFIDDGTETGSQLFANKTVRQALSMAIDREAIAASVVYAKAATGLVPYGVFESGSAKSSFRDKCTENYENLTTNVEKAKSLLANEGINASKYSFSITVATYDEVHRLIAEAVAQAWNALGFNVTINTSGTIANNDYYKYTESVAGDICDDLYVEDLKNKSYEVIALDYCAISADPFSVLAPLAKAFSGQGMDMTDPENYKLTPHSTGYDSEEYNAIMETIFAEKNIAARADKYREAESILMEDMPIIPIIFNQNGYVISNQLKTGNKFIFWTTRSSYYYTNIFTKASVKKYDDYLVSCESFLVSKYDTYKTNPLSYFNNFKNDKKEPMSYEEFKGESSIYSYLFPSS